MHCQAFVSLTAQDCLPCFSRNQTLCTCKQVEESFSSSGIPYPGFGLPCLSLGSWLGAFEKKLSIWICVHDTIWSSGRRKGNSFKCLYSSTPIPWQFLCPSRTDSLQNDQRDSNGEHYQLLMKQWSVKTRNQSHGNYLASGVSVLSFGLFTDLLVCTILTYSLLRQWVANHRKPYLWSSCTGRWVIHTFILR